MGERIDESRQGTSRSYVSDRSVSIDEHEKGKGLLLGGDQVMIEPVHQVGSE